MKPSCRFAMAVHVLTLLASKGSGCVSSAFLASSVNTNPVVIRRLLLALQEANLIETRKGPGLGSRLSCPPARINLAEVYRAVEDHEPFVLPSHKPNGACPIGPGIRAALARIFASTQLALERELARTTLADILEAARGSRAGVGGVGIWNAKAAGKALSSSISEQEAMRGKSAGI